MAMCYISWRLCGTSLLWLVPSTGTVSFRKNDCKEREFEPLYVTCRLSKALGAVERLGHGRIPSQEGMKAAITERSGGVAFWSMLAAAVASCMLEATTTQLDNIFLPLHHYAMLLA